MRATPGGMWAAIRAGQDCVERVPFFVSVLVVYVVVCIVCVSVAAVVYVVGGTNFETGAFASVSLCALLLLASLLVSLTLTGLARLSGLPSLVGLTTRRATSTA